MLISPSGLTPLTVFGTASLTRVWFPTSSIHLQSILRTAAFCQRNVSLGPLYLPIGYL